MSKEVKTALVVVGIAAALFVGYRGIKYAQCVLSCKRDCVTEARQSNPLARYGVSNDLGRVSCEWRVKTCRKECDFP